MISSNIASSSKRRVNCGMSPALMASRSGVGRRYGLATAAAEALRICSRVGWNATTALAAILNVGFGLRRMVGTMVVGVVEL